MLIMIPIQGLRRQECEGLRLRQNGDQLIVALVHDDPAEPEIVTEIIGQRRGDLAIFDDEPNFRAVQNGRLLKAGELEPDALDGYRMEARLLVETLHETVL